MFVVGVFMGVVQTIPVLRAADAAADNIERLETKLRAIAAGAPATPEEPPKHFGTIEMRNVVFRYSDRSSDAVFQVGPFDFTLQSGELVFITGGNGSGKSTFFKLLAGLYQPDYGEIFLDGVRIDDRNRDLYRSLIPRFLLTTTCSRGSMGLPIRTLQRSIGC